AYAKSTTGNSNFTVGDVPINFHDPEEDEYQGVCYIYSDNSREIIIRKRWWDAVNVDDRESLIYHELGHCKLDREHDNATEQNVKLSMMNQYIVLGTEYSQ